MSGRLAQAAYARTAILRQPSGKRVSRVAVSPDGESLALCLRSSGDEPESEIALWKLSVPRGAVYTLSVPFLLNGVVWPRFCVGATFTTDDGSIIMILSAKAGKLRTSTLKVSNSSIAAIAYREVMSSEHLLAVASVDGVGVWRLHDGGERSKRQIELKLGAADGQQPVATYWPDKDSLWTVCSDGSIMKHNVNDGSITFRYNVVGTGYSSITSAVFGYEHIESRDFLAFIDATRCLRVINLSKLEMGAVEFSVDARYAVFVHGGQAVAYGCGDGEVTISDVVTGDVLTALKHGRADSVHAVSETVKKPPFLCTVARSQHADEVISLWHVHYGTQRTVRDHFAERPWLKYTIGIGASLCVGVIIFLMARWFAGNGKLPSTGGTAPS